MADMREVLLFSGGMDSSVYWVLHRPVGLFIRTGTPDNKREERVVRDIAARFPAPTQIATLDMSWLATKELSNKIIPARNLFFVAAAAMYGENIVLCSTLGDSTRDKDERFARLSSELLSYIYSEGTKRPEGHSGIVKVCLPFRNLTKASILSLVVKAIGRAATQELMQLSRSCYSGGSKECGVCRSCLRKLVAMVVNGLSVEPIFDRLPTREEMSAHVLACQVKLRGLETIDTRQAFREMFE